MNELKDLKVSHTSLARGYVSRKNTDGIVEKYEGRFGKGYKVFTPNWDSTRYCYVTYYVEA